MFWFLDAKVRKFSVTCKHFYDFNTFLTLRLNINIYNKKAPTTKVSAERFLLGVLFNVCFLAVDDIDTTLCDFLDLDTIESVYFLVA